MKQYTSKLRIKRGRYGSSKVKGFIVLMDYPPLTVPSPHKITIPRYNPPLSARQLCLVTGIGYRSLGRALPRWVGFEYVTRQPILIGGDYEYQLDHKAKRWLRLAWRHLPNYQLFVDELVAWQDIVTDEVINDMMRMPFNAFIAKLDEMIKNFKANKNIIAKTGKTGA